MNPAKKGELLRARAPGRLLDFLRAELAGWRRKTLEQRLREGCVEVNGATITRPHHELRADDEVRVLPEGEGQNPALTRGVPGLVILHADEELVAIDKPAGLLSVPLEGRAGRNALALVREAFSRPGRPVRVWPVHRLDRESSGVLLFARTSAARDAVQAGWTEARKTYLALVEGRPDPQEGLIDQPLYEDAALNVRVGTRPDSKPARTRYKTLESVRGRSLLELELETGRRHQIRAHLAFLGHPIVGDPRYGRAGARMGLHSLRLTVVHPEKHVPVTFEAPVPADFLALTR